MLNVRSSFVAVSSILAFTAGIGCSSGSSSTTVTDGGTSSVDTGAAPTGGSTCDHVIAPSPPLGLDDAVQAIATDGTDVFLLTTASTGDRLVWLVKGGTTTQVADVQSDVVINLQIPTLLVDANNFYVDANRSGAQAIYAVSRTGSGAATALATLSSNGEQNPHFVADDTYLYFAGNDPDDSLTRVPRAGGTPEIITGGVFDDSGNFGGVTIAVDSTSFYAFINGEDAGAYSMLIVSKAPTPSGAPPIEPNTLHYVLGQCTSGAFHIEITPSGYLAPCTDNGSVPTATVQSWLYAMPTAAANATNIAGSILATGPTLDPQTFAAASGNAYYDDSYGNESQAYVYKVATAGGTPAQMMKTRGVSLMAVVGTNLVVAGACGIQQVGL